MQTYQEYHPKTLLWPDLDEVALTRLRSVPFWQEVFYTERRAGAIVKAFTETVDQISKPSQRLRRYSMPPPGHKKQSIELLKQVFRPSLFVPQMFPLGFRDFLIRMISSGAQPADRLAGCWWNS